MVPLRQERPYHSDSTASRLLSEVKHCRARLVLRWGTTLESLVLFFCSFCHSFWPLLTLSTIRNIIALIYYPPLSCFFCSAFPLAGLVAEFWEVVIKIRSWLRCIYCMSHRPSIFSHPDVDERCQELNLLILVWLHLHEKRYPLSLSYVWHVVDRSWSLPHVYWSTAGAAEPRPSAMLPTKGSICWDYNRIGSSSISIGIHS